MPSPLPRLFVLLVALLQVLPRPAAAHAASRMGAAATDPDSLRDMVGVVRAMDLDITQHFCTTADGYVLSLFHLTKPGDGPVSVLRGGRRRRTALLMHGLLDSSVVWVNNNRDNSLGPFLLSRGWDVWMGNNRGNKWSRRHTRLATDSDEFWDFSWDEMARHDFPALVDCVLRESGAKTLTYVGHSQGVTQAFAGLSLPDVGPGLASKLDHVVGLAPVAYIHHMKSVLMKTMAELDGDDLTNLLGVREFAPTNLFYETVLPNLCRVDSARECQSLLESVYGPSRHLNTTREQVFLSTFPAGTSTRNVQHYGQSTRENKFGFFDHGREKNIKRYGSHPPPTYSLGAYPRDVPTFLFHGTNDALVAPEDLARLRRELPAEVRFFEVDEFAHVDFVWGKDPAERVFAKLLRLLEGGGGEIAAQQQQPASAPWAEALARAWNGGGLMARMF
jgi:lysosomal acid lipase/cholesteryl ester hydrolase